MATLGGKRAGAGRKPGQTSRPQLRDSLTKKQIADLLKKAEDLAMAGDSLMLKFLLEQIYGKAPQTISGDPENPLEMKITGVSIKIKK